MLADEVEETVKKITALEIQGARRIAQAAIKAMALQAKESDSKTLDGFKSDLLVAADALAKARPTEPMLQNSLRLLFVQLERHGHRAPRNVNEARRIILEQEDLLLKHFDASINSIGEFGSNLIPGHATVLTHCHSTTVMAALKQAFENKKEPRVICTETRPKQQGFITAKELAEIGIDVTLIVDSAVKSVMSKVDLVLVGADSITSTGDLINKIGTSGVATIAKESDVPFHSCAELYKFDPLTIWGRTTEVEQRPAWEIADPYQLKGVKIMNSAFDKTDAKYITGYITEKGVVSPHAIRELAMQGFLGD